MDDGSDQPLPSYIGAVWTIILGAFFFLIYGLCNWITSMRPGVGSFYWSWESGIPFVPALILPYMSLDLFFAGAIFLCRRGELKTHVKRVVTAILLAAVCFLLFPLKFSFIRPATTGFSGLLFDWLKLDQPYNQMPSLHIALCAIVWAPYARRTHGLLRYILIGWFILIAASAVLTYQHHMIDILGGAILATIVFFLFPWPAASDEDGNHLAARNLRVATVYGLSALALFTVAYVFRPWGWLVLWPAASMLLVALAYAGAGPRIFRKRHGRFSWAATVLLSPYLFGARISHAMYRRSSDSCCQVTPNIILGGRLNRTKTRQLAAEGITAVLDLTPECREPRWPVSVHYKNLQILDLTLPSESLVREAVKFIKDQAGVGTVYVHCALGFSRSAGVLAAYLLESSAASTAEEAIEMIRRVRPQIVVTPQWTTLLRQFE
jgi:protein-tyrosine phosphatase/membrane-associated phospholipid phosphatase